MRFCVYAATPLQSDQCLRYSLSGRYIQCGRTTCLTQNFNLLAIVSEAVLTGLSPSWSETQKTDSLSSRQNYILIYFTDNVNPGDKFTVWVYTSWLIEFDFFNLFNP